MQTADMRKVLIVEDSLPHREWAIDLCRQLDFASIQQASNGEEGMAILRQELPDLLLLDLEMPRMNGVELLQQLAEEKLCPYIILMSSKDYALISTVEMMGHGLNLPVLGGLKKPLHIGEMQDLLQRISVENISTETSNVLCDAADIRHALDQQHIIPYYQAKTDLNNGQLKGAEMLARWQHPEQGLIPPSRFIPVIEEEGWATELTLLMLEQGLNQWQEWARQGLRLQLAINLSALSLQGNRLISAIESRLQRSRVPARYIIFEITETAVATNLAEAIGIAARLRLAGLGLSIDDFGTGFATMQQLARFPFTELKIDQSLVRDIANKPHMEAIASSIIELGRRLQLHTVAEGIETEQDLLALQQRGCDQGQGYFIARPMEAGQLLRWAREYQPGRGQLALPAGAVSTSSSRSS